MEKNGIFFFSSQPLKRVISYFGTIARICPMERMFRMIQPQYKTLKPGPASEKRKLRESIHFNSKSIPYQKSRAKYNFHQPECMQSQKLARILVRH